MQSQILVWLIPIYLTVFMCQNAKAKWHKSVCMFNFFTFLSLFFFYSGQIYFTILQTSSWAAEHWARSAAVICVHETTKINWSLLQCCLLSLIHIKSNPPTLC